MLKKLVTVLLNVTGWSYTSRTDLTTGADRTGYASAAYII